ncbi:multiple sugar transport system permease protein [Deinobacterium chartae]|uniref:Multiple sugar transport system permease protein n=1 Tax=Deinobacterium chartae TaxID=521158 RepID=A0A841HZ23_9DEIO|nr:carbohydrate ABC transporter permease [Deinobacterium chartae]MBB6097228.1 multiple sugar transport system permease protein [Deinobacterium chartae]
MTARPASLATGRSSPDAAWIARRRWARAAWVYVLLLLASLLFLGPFLMGVLSSFKSNPNEYPPRVAIPQLNPVVWGRAFRLGVAGAGDGWYGGLRPGADVPFEVTLRTPPGQPPTPPQVNVARRGPVGGLGALRPKAFASDFARIEKLEEIARHTTERGLEVSYRFRVVYPPLTDKQGETLRGVIPAAPSGSVPADALEVHVNGEPVAVTLDTPEAQGKRFQLNPETPVELVRAGGRYYLRGPVIDRTPIDVNIERGQELTRSTLEPTFVERFGRALGYQNITPGVIGYVFYNYLRVFNESVDLTTGKSLFGQWILNSFLVAALVVVTNVIFASLAGYALARLRFPGRSLLFFVVLFSMMVPIQVIFLSNYLLLRDGLFGLSQLFGHANFLNLAGLVLSSAMSAGGVFLMKQFFEGLPRELEEAAFVDGATPLQTFWRVMLPQATPGLLTLTITTFQGSWNGFFWPLIVLSNPPSTYTLPIGLLSFKNAYGGVGDFALTLAGSVISALPVIIVFLVFQRYFVESSTSTGVKG